MKTAGCSVAEATVRRLEKIVQEYRNTASQERYLGIAVDSVATPTVNLLVGFDATATSDRLRSGAGRELPLSRGSYK